MPTKLCKSNPLSFWETTWKNEKYKESQLGKHSDQMINLASSELWMFYLPSKFRTVKKQQNKTKKQTDMIQRHFLALQLLSLDLWESRNTIHSLR